MMGQAFILWAVMLLSNGQQIAMKSTEPTDLPTCQQLLRELPRSVEEQLKVKVTDGQGMCLPVTSI